MSNYMKFYEEHNNRIEKDFNNSLTTIKEINYECEKHIKDNILGEYYKLFYSISNIILKTSNLEEELKKDYFGEKSFDQLLKDNHELYSEMFLENYFTSYLNPSFSVSVFGKDFGQLISFIYKEYMEYIDYAYKHKIYKMYAYNNRFIELYNYIVKNEKLEYEKLKEIIKKSEDEIIDDTTMDLIETMVPEFDFYDNIIINSDLSDLRYLFKYGRYISNNEIKTAEMLNGYPEDKIEKLANTVVDAFLKGFERHNKDRNSRDIIRITHIIGEERVTNQIIKAIEERGLRAKVVGLTSTEINKQMIYDHRFDNSLYLTDSYAGIVCKAYNQGVEEYKDTLLSIAGNMIMLVSGERFTKLENKVESLTISQEQNKVLQKLNMNMRKTLNKYIPKKETSYTGVTFPIPEIGEDIFKDVYDDMLHINTLDSVVYEKIQQTIIDELDKGEFVHVKGKGNNQTDIWVKLYELKDPEKETIFDNCGADVNNPVGEVFTSPVLKGTNGILHVDEVLIRDVKYNNLKLKFKDGYVEDYSCENYDDLEENKKLIKENLFLSQETLPLGEFAIGTNTYAYVVAKKYNIFDVLHTIMAEKMGPHFAVGDTCFAWNEDEPRYNMFNNKEVVARENEKTALRKVDLDKAYTNTHSDITLPYESIEYVTIVTKSKEKIDIIRDGKFVLKGTERLNKPFN